MTFAPLSDDAGVARLNVGPDALVDMIMARYHTVHRNELPHLIRLAQRVEALHPGHPAVPRGLAALLARIRTNLEAHMKKEEDGLFPAMRERQSVSAVAIEIMRDEHDDHGKHLDELRRLTADHIPPPDASADWRLLCEGTRKFAEDVAEHIRLENDVLSLVLQPEVWELPPCARVPQVKLNCRIADGEVAFSRLQV